MRYKIFLLLGLFLFSSVNIVVAADTDAEVNFAIGGCSFSFDDAIYGIPTKTCANSLLVYGDARGMYYCDEDNDIHPTLELGVGCSMGKTDYNPATDPSCCPATDYCNKVSNGVYQCESRTELCADQVDETTCTSLPPGCIWLKNSLSCVATIDDLSCGYYNTSEECEADNLNLATIGVGSEVLGTYVECNDMVFSVLTDNSSCEWNSITNKCSINYVAVDSSGSDVSFSCSNDYSLGACKDGVQTVTWSSDNTSTGFGTGVPKECLTALNCAGGEDERFCGEPPIKLPGFGMFSLISSLLIIGMFYLLKERNIFTKKLFRREGNLKYL